MDNKLIDADGLTRWLLSTPVLMAVSLISLVGMGFWTPLFDLDEGAFSEATREMLASGNWVSTYLNGEPRHDKPIMIYWLQALSASVFGINSFAFRLPSVIAALCWLWLVYHFVKDYFSTKAAAIAVWVMACTTLVSVIGKAATADALLNLLLTASFFQIFRFWYRQNQVSTPEDRNTIYTRCNFYSLLKLGVLFGLGFLTKGPVAVALPLVTALIAFALKGQFLLWLKACLHPASWLTFIVIILPWHIAVYLDQGWGFFEGFYLGHNLGRFSSTMESHGGTPLYYILALPFLLLPFSRQFFMILGRVAGHIKSLQIRDLPLINIYFCVWFVLTLVLFSFSQTQLPHYLLYGLVPVFISMAQRLAEPGKAARIWDSAIPVATLLLFSWIPTALMALLNKDDNYDAATALAGWQAFSGGLWLIALGITLAAIVVLFVKSIRPLNRALVLGFLSILACNFVLLPTLSTGQQQPVYDLAQRINQEFSNSRVIAYKTNMPSFSVYTNRIVARMDPAPGDVIFLRIDKVEQLQERFPEGEFSRLAQSGGLALYRRDQ